MGIGSRKHVAGREKMRKKRKEGSRERPGYRGKEKGSWKREEEEEEEVKGRKCRTTWLQRVGSRKQEEGRGGLSERKEVQDYLATEGRKQEAGRGKRRAK